MSVRGLSRRAYGRDEYITRCRCGAWTYRGKQCETCLTLEGRNSEQAYIHRADRSGRDPDHPV